MPAWPIGASAGATPKRLESRGAIGVSLIFTHSLTLAAAALLVEAALGYPDFVLRAIGHPVMWIGALISWLDRRLNRDDAPALVRRLAGMAALLTLAGVPTGLAWLVERGLALLPAPIGVATITLLATTLLAQRSLDAHVRAVADGLRADGLVGGRRAVSMIVGRNPQSLDLQGVCRAAIESLAENFSDGVVSPLLWLALGGLPGLVLFKAVNTADSMIGHRSARHAAFGWAAARLDDGMNLPGARLSVLWIALAAAVSGANGKGAMQAAWRDARRHRSPNAGWPEAAMAGALGLRLAGPRVYGAILVEDAWMGDGTPDASEADLRRALLVYRVACAVQIAAFVALAVIVRG